MICRCRCVGLVVEIMFGLTFRLGLVAFLGVLRSGRRMFGSCCLGSR